MNVPANPPPRRSTRISSATNPQPDYRVVRRIRHRQDTPVEADSRATPPTPSRRIPPHSLEHETQPAVHNPQSRPLPHEHPPTARTQHWLSETRSAAPYANPNIPLERPYTRRVTCNECRRNHVCSYLSSKTATKTNSALRCEGELPTCERCQQNDLPCRNSSLDTNRRCSDSTLGDAAL
jgi:hypothetical protein